MGYAILDDNLHSHPKILNLIRRDGGRDALALWTLALSWAHAQTRSKPENEQGIVPEYVMAMWMTPDEVHRGASNLVAVGLWELLPDRHIRIHGFRDWQRLDLRETAVQNGRKGAQKRWHPDEPTLFDGAPDRGANGGLSCPPNDLPTPTPPLPQPLKNQDQNTSASHAAEFDKFWDAYGYKTGKQAAIKAWAKAIKDTPPARIITVAAAEGDRWGDKTEYRKHPSTWLRAGCWDDDLPDERESASFDHF